MKALTLSTTIFEIHYHEPIKASLHGNDYVFHNMGVSHEIIINNKSHWVTYQNGHSFRCNDYNAPSNQFELYDENDSLPSLIFSLCAKDFEDEELILEKLAKAKDFEPAIDSLDKLWQIYECFHEDVPCLEDFLRDEEFSYNVEDYIENEFGELTFKGIDLEELKESLYQELNYCFSLTDWRCKNEDFINQEFNAVLNSFMSENFGSNYLETEEGEDFYNFCGCEMRNEFQEKATELAR